MKRSDQGAALIMVLVLLTVLSIALGAMFGNAGANFATSTLVSVKGRTFYAADGEMEVVIQQLRSDSMACSHLALPEINGERAKVQCSPFPPNTFSITAHVDIPGASSTTAAVVTIGTDGRVSIQSWVTVTP